MSLEDGGLSRASATEPVEDVVEAASNRAEAVKLACLDRCSTMAGRDYDYPPRMRRIDWIILSILTVATGLLMYLGQLV